MLVGGTSASSLQALLDHLNETEPVALPSGRPGGSKVFRFDKQPKAGNREVRPPLPFALVGLTGGSTASDVPLPLSTGEDMDLMRAMLSPHQAHALMGLESGWYWVGRDKTLRTLTSRDEGKGLHTALLLTDEQIALLEQVPHINRVLNILQDTGHDMGAVDPLHLARCICQGRQVWAFSDEHEHVICALHCVPVHEQFDRLPEVRNAMTAEVSQGRSAITALDRFDDAYWQSMANSRSRIGQA